MQSRLLAAASALALTTIASVLALTPASPASAHCSGHSTHPDRYSGNDVSFRDGANIRTHPHTSCTSLGLGYHEHGIDVHCVVLVDNSSWLYLRDTTTGVSGWSRSDALNIPRGITLPRC
jgi:hypothetical protein